LDVTIDVTASGKPSGLLVTGFEPSLDSSVGVAFGVTHVRDETVSEHQVSEYQIDLGADSILPGATGGTLTLPTAFTRLTLESSAALNVATLQLTPSNTTATYECTKDTRGKDSRREDPLSFEGEAKDVVAKDACAKTVATAVMNQLIDGIEEAGLDVPDAFVFSRIDRTNSGYTMVVNGASVPTVVGAGCTIQSIDTSQAVKSVGE
jgi:hypothetical protein